MLVLTEPRTRSPDDRSRTRNQHNMTVKLVEFALILSHLKRGEGRTEEPEPRVCNSTTVHYI